MCLGDRVGVHSVIKATHVSATIPLFAEAVTEDPAAHVNGDQQDKIKAGR